MVKKPKFNYALIVKLLISALILLFLVYKLDLGLVMNLLRRISFSDILLLFFWYLLTVLVTSFRWGFLLRAKGLGISFINTVRIYLIGFFFNNFLPTGIGGDIARAYHISRISTKLKEAVASILVERLLGLVATLMIALLMLPFCAIDSRFKILIIALNLLIWILGLALSIQWSAKLIILLITKIPFRKAGQKLGNLVEAIHLFRYNPGAILKAFFFSLLYQFTLIFYYFLVSDVLNIHVDLKLFLIFVPLIWVISLIPISLNALGVREAGFAFFFEQIGQPGSEGFIVSLLGFTIIVCASLIGGLLFLLGKEKGKRVET
ncbi:flippase-like domain-containing protein [bacterium]|nr:flippase-like domain-containing protein [bacterium]